MHPGSTAVSRQGPHPPTAEDTIRHHRIHARAAAPRGGYSAMAITIRVATASATAAAVNQHDRARPELVVAAAPQRFGDPRLAHAADHEHHDRERAVAEAERAQLPLRARGEARQHPAHADRHRSGAEAGAPPREPGALGRERRAAGGVDDLPLDVLLVARGHARKVAPGPGPGGSTC